MTDPPDPLVTVRPPLRASRTLAVILSFLVPGTGQLMNGRTRAGLLLLAPFLLVIFGGIVAFGGDHGQMLGFLRGGSPAE